ncbi:MAG: hypothetical protein ACRD3C_06525 [Vicinamibacterales bacterium]
MTSKTDAGGDFRYRDSGSGRFLTPGQASRKPPNTVERERIKQPSAPPSKGGKK